MIIYNDNDVVRSEGEVAETLAVFDADYVFGLIEMHISRRFEKHFVPIPNIVNSFKMIFDNLRLQFPSDTENTNIKEEQVYDEIIRSVCEKCNMNFNSEQATDSKFLIAACLYDVCVSNFSKYFINFLYSVVIRDKENIYVYLNDNNLIRDKDCETIYNLKNMEDSKLAIIIANFDKVIDCLMELDIGFDEFIATSIEPVNEQAAKIILYNFNYNGSFFSDILKYISKDNTLFSTYVNEIRLMFMGV